MNIVLPIIINIILVALFVLTFSINKRLTLKQNLLTLIILCATAVGGYFLVTNIPMQWAYNLLGSAVLSDMWVNITLISILCVVADFIITFIMLLNNNSVYKEAINDLNTAKVKRAHALSSKTDRSIRRQERRSLKETLREHFKECTFATVMKLIITFVIALLITTCAYVQVKSTLAFIQDKTSIEWIDDGYEYTGFGQIENLLDKE